MSAASPRTEMCGVGSLLFRLFPPTVPLVTTTVSGVECDSEPLVPVTVTVYVASGVNAVVVTLRVEVAVPPEMRVTLVGLRVVVIVGVLGATVDDRATVPVNPLLVRVI